MSDEPGNEAAVPSNVYGDSKVLSSPPRYFSAGCWSDAAHAPESAAMTPEQTASEFAIDPSLYKSQILGRLKERQCGCLCDGDAKIAMDIVQSVSFRLENGVLIHEHQKTIRLPICGCRFCGESGCPTRVVREDDPTTPIASFCCGAVGVRKGTWALDFSRVKDVDVMQGTDPKQEVVIHFSAVDHGHIRGYMTRIPAARDPKAMVDAIMAIAAAHGVLKKGMPSVDMRRV